MPSPRSRSGQAAVEYVAVLALLVAVLAGAGVALGANELPGAVVRHVRVALCIVGGDVCRAADARAAGLRPCTVAERLRRQSNALSIGLLRIGAGVSWSYERRSDGSLLLTRREGGEAGPTAGFGVRLGPVADLHAGGSAALGFARGSAWELADERALERVVRAMVRDPLHPHRALPAPTYRFIEGGTLAGADAGVGLGGERGNTSSGLGSASVREALGRRVGGGRTTWYYDLHADFETLLPSVGGAGRAMLEYTDGAPPTLVMRGTPFGRGARSTEVVGHQVLSDPADAARVRRFLRFAIPVKPMALAEARTIFRRLKEAGTIERLTYAVESDSHSGAYGAGAGVQAVFEHSGETVRRRLVDAEVLGDAPAKRRDCTGV